jgi:hypothetical protein
MWVSDEGVSPHERPLAIGVPVARVYMPRLVNDNLSPRAPQR